MPRNDHDARLRNRRIRNLSEEKRQRPNKEVKKRKGRSGKLKNS